MKKILILSDFFPPCNLTPAERILSFAEYLNEFGYYPVVVTRNWDIPLSQPNYEREKTGTEVIHIKNENYEVYYVPYRPTLRDRLFKKFYATPFYFIYLAVALIYSIGELYSSRFTSFIPLYKQCRDILKKQKDFSFLLVSGSPFHLFKFGYKIKKEFGLRWIADYRDDWNTNEVPVKTGEKYIGKATAKRNEVKWVGSASFFITVSDHYVNKISNLLPAVPGYTIMNGYMKSNYAGLTKSINDSFSIVYVGYLYPGQPIEVFVEGYISFLKSTPSVRSKVTFVGMKDQPEQLRKIKQITKGYEEHFDFTLRVTKKEAITIQNNATVLLLCAHASLKGTPGSKMYEYIALEKPVLVCPSDKEIIEETLRETGQGYFANSAEECTQKLKELYKEYGTGNVSANNIKKTALEKYSRYENAKKLAHLLDKLNTTA